MTETTTASMTPDEALAQARERLTEATDAHQDAREASDAARATLAGLEAAADRGEDVNTGAYTEAKADLGLKSRRTAALAAQVAQAQQAVDAAQKAVDHARLVDMADALPDPSKAEEKARKAVREYLAALDAQADATNALLAFARAQGLPDTEHPAPEGATGWPCFTFTGSTQPPRLTSRIGHLVVDGRKIGSVSRRDLGQRFADEIARLAQQRAS